MAVENWTKHVKVWKNVFDSNMVGGCEMACWGSAHGNWQCKPADPTLSGTPTKLFANRWQI